jgi:lysophospholipase L1-like esterase
MLERWPAATDVLPEAINIISPEITAVTPHRDPRGGLRTGYINQHQRFVEYARKEKPELVFLGDSITAGWPRELLTTHFAKYKPANNGISGDWVQGLRWRVAHGVYDEIQPRVIVVLIGVNNLSNGFLPEEVALGTQLLVNDIRAKTPKTRILLLGIFPRGRTFIPPAGDDIRKVNALTAQLADQQYVFFMDLADQLIEPDGSISAEVFPDGLHPGRPGYQRWADAIAPTLAKLFEMTL